MKKNVVFLLLILALCLGLCACDTNSDPSSELKAAVCGTWYERYQANGENPGYFYFQEDGNGTINGQQTLTWTGKQDRNNEFLWTVTILTESQEQYTLAVNTGNRDYSEAWLSVENDTDAYCYLKADTVIPNAWFSDLMTMWYAQDGNAPAQAVALNADGTVQLGSKTCFWTNGSDWMYDENGVHLHLYNAQGFCGSLEVYIRANGLYDFLYFDASTNRGYNYYNLPVLGMMENGSWESFDRVTMIDDYFYLDPRCDFISIGDREYAVRFDTSAALNNLTVNLLEDDVLRYVAEVFMDGEYPMVTLTDQQSGQQTLYFNNHYGYAEGNMDALYYRTMNLVHRYLNNSGVYTLETDEYLDADDRLPYIYQKLTELNGYRQTQEYLDRFTIVPSVLTEVIQYHTDQLNNVHENTLARYNYDQNGVMVSGSGEEIIEKYGVDHTSTQYFTYDSRGNIAEIRVGTNNIYALGTPIFDTAGKMVGMHVQEPNDDYTTVFTFDVKGRVVRMGVSETESAYPLVYEYTYDDAGRVVTKVKTCGYQGTVIITSNYTYTGDELTQIKQYHQEWNNNYSTTYTYTSDEQGRPLSAVITTTDPNNAYQFQEIKYVYKELYFFDSTGLTMEGN